MFVDSDDWVDQKYCEIPFRAAEYNNVDLVVFRAFSVKDVIIRDPCIYNENINQGLDFFTAYEYGGTVVWNKLYKRVLFNEVRFPEGRVHEDIAMTHKLVYKANKIILLSNCLYYHRYRRQSITHSRSKSFKEDYNHVIKQRFVDFMNYDFDSQKSNNKYLCAYAIGYLSRTIPSKDIIYMRAKEIVDSTEDVPKNMSYKQKICYFFGRTIE